MNGDDPARSQPLIFFRYIISPIFQVEYLNEFYVADGFLNGKANEQCTSKAKSNIKIPKNILYVKKSH